MNVLTIDADYWFPMEQGGHCGRCSDHTRLRHRSESMDNERTVPSIADIVKMVRPGTPIKVTESHAEMFFILYRLHLATGKMPYVVNIDEHPDTGQFDIDNISIKGSLVNTKGEVRINYLFFGSNHLTKGDPVHCGSWVEAAIIGGWLRAKDYEWIGQEGKFDQWRSSKKGKNFQPDLVHVCRSSPYMSKLGDTHFADMVLSLERASQRRASIYGHSGMELWGLIERRSHHVRREGSVR